MNADKNLYSVCQIRQIEQRYIMDDNQKAYELMQRAGLAAWKVLQKRWPAAKKISIVCGKGNNGGDGYELAALATLAGIDCRVYSTGDSDELSPVAKLAYEKALASGVACEAWDNQAIDADLIVDALLGIGINGDVESPYLEVINAINEAQLPVFSIDVPSGLNADTGYIMGAAIKATATITFIALKMGLYVCKARAHVGQIFFDSLDISEKHFAEIESSADLCDVDALNQALPIRNRAAHKGSYGHVLVIGGDYGMGGAVRLAAEAAIRSGAGLVTVATRPEHVNIVTGARPEIMSHQVTTAEDLEPLLARATVIVIGPGLGQGEWSQELLSRVLTADQPKVLDADSLNLLKHETNFDNNWILTPHIGEAARLLGCDKDSLLRDLYKAALKIQQQYSGVIVLKGAGTIIKAAEGLPSVCEAGNPGMASGGMGDVLSGIIGGMLAQGLDLKTAAVMGVEVHARAADIAAKEGGERGLLATDLLSKLRNIVNPEQPE